MDVPASSASRTTDDAPLPLFLPLLKVDRRTGAFVAKAALEVPDDAREVCDYASSRPNFERLEKRCLEESGGKKVAPLREMHGLIAAGNVTRFDYDDLHREITCFGTITNPDSLAKAIDGTLCGVSMGGLKRYLGYDPRRPGVKRYEAVPKEISLVDLGCIPGTGLTMLNAAGGTIAVVDGDAVEPHPIPGLAERLSKVAGSLREFENAVEDAVRRLYGVDEQNCARAWARDIYETAVVVATDGKLVRHELVRNADGTVTLGESGIPVVVTYVPVAPDAGGTFGEALRAVGDMLAEMARGDEAVLANATDALRSMRKRVQRMHDCATEMGAVCAAPLQNATHAAQGAEEDLEMDPKELAKVVREVVRTELGLEGDQQLAKAIGGTVETVLGLKDGAADQAGILAKAIGGAIATTLGLGADGAAADGVLAKAIGGALTPLTEKITTLETQVGALLKQPEPAKGGLFSLEKALDGGGAARNALGDAALRELAKADPVAAIKLLQAQPGAGMHIDTHGASPIAAG